MRKQTKQWPGHIAECFSSRAAPRRTVLCRAAGTGQALTNLLDTMATVVHVGSGGEAHTHTGGSAAQQVCCERPPGTSAPASSQLGAIPRIQAGGGITARLQCHSQGPGWGWHPLEMAHMMQSSVATTRVAYTAGSPRCPEVQKDILVEGRCCLVK